MMRNAERRGGAALPMPLAQPPAASAASLPNITVAYATRVMADMPKQVPGKVKWFNGTEGSQSEEAKRIRLSGRRGRLHEVKNHPKNFKLTLSGHTHGMQFGIEIPGIKWSPVKYRYPKWAGMYEEGGRYLNVNRGFGFLAFPGRVGIWPEITVLELKRRDTA